MFAMEIIVLPFGAADEEKCCKGCVLVTHVTSAMVQFKLRYLNRLWSQQCIAYLLVPHHHCPQLMSCGY